MKTTPFSHHHLILFKGDFERLAELHQTNKPTVVIRQLVRKHIEAVEAKLQERNDGHI